MFNPISTNCNGGCSIDTTPCPQPQWSNGYPAYGLNGVEYNGYSYKSSTGFEAKYTPAKDGKYYLEDQINAWTHSGKPMAMFKGMLETAKTVSQLLYEVEDLNALYDIEASSGLGMKAVKFKSINNMDIGLSPDGQSFVWAEYLPERPVMYVVRDETTPTNVILLADKNGEPIDFTHPSYKDLVKVNDVISVYRNDPNACDDGGKACCSMFLERAVVAVGTAEFNGKVYPAITLEGGSMTGEPEKWTFKGRNGFGGNLDASCFNNVDRFPGGVYPGDEVRFEYSSFDPCNPIVGSYQLQGYTMKKSNIQYVGKDLCLSWAELRKGYSHPGGVSAILGQRLSAITKGFIEEQARVFYLGQNRDMYNASGIPGSTMGIITEIYAAHAQKPWLKLVRSAINAVTPQDKAMLFMETLMQVQQSKWSGQNPTITVVMDNQALHTFTMLRRAFKELGGWIELHQGDTFDFSKMPVIRTPYGNMEIMTCSFLTQISRNSGMMLFLDKNLVGARQTSEFVVDLTNGSNQVREVATTGFQIKDVTDQRVVGCKCWQVWTSFAYVMVGIGQNNSPYAIIEGFTL